MSLSVNLQDVIIARLKGNGLVAALIGDRVYDGVPSDPGFPYISFGPSDFRTDDADCVRGREETFQLDCWSRDKARLWPCKKLVDAVVRALVVDGQEIEETENGFALDFRVELARVFLDPDGTTAHGVVQVTIIAEELD